jgi:glutamine synthetase
LVALRRGRVHFADIETLEQWIAKKRQEERDVLDRPHPYEVELYYDL